MLVYYLKYRPQSLGDLIGQESVKKNILSSFKENKLAHAYLFAGPRGTGKTSLARILAKMINCESLESSDKSQEKQNPRLSTLATSNYPCNKCQTCISITDGSNLDLIEIDAASNRGIEDIRALREKIKLAPTAARKKVYIIDEVHMLTTEAFNALLKTLEEPPSHALFILATTDASKLPQTILSRLQRLDFKLASPKELEQALEKIIKMEKIEIEGEALKFLIKKADGSFRDGVKLLDQVSSEKKITLDILTGVLKSSAFEDTLDLIEAFGKKDAKYSLLKISRLVEEGIDIKEFILALMDTLRNLVLIKNGLGEQLVQPHLIEEKYRQLFKISDNFTSKDLINYLDFLQKALEKLKVASIPSLPLEIAVVEICEESAKGKMQSAGLEEADKKVEGEYIGQIQNPTPQILESGSEPPPTSESDSTDILRIKEKWIFVLETIRPYNFSLEALLRSTHLRECTQDLLIMEVPYSFHQRILEAPKNRDLLEGIFSEILGRPIKVSTVLGARPQRREDLANVEVAADDEIIRVAAEIFNSDSVN